MFKVAELFVKHQVNIIFIIFDVKRHELDAIEKFQRLVKQLSADKIVSVEAHICIDPKPREVEELMVQRVANFKMPKNAPLIIETFV